MRMRTLLPGLSRVRRAASGPALLVVAAALASSLVSSAALAQNKKPNGKKKPPAAPAPAAAPAEAAAPKPVIGKNGIEVTIVEQAGTKAFIQPGEKAGVHRGATVTLNHKEYKVIQTSDSYAVIDVGTDAVHEKEKGGASVVADMELKAAELPAPRPLSTWSNEWPEEEAPANQETPRFVPLGGEERDRRFDVRLTAAGGALIPIGNQVGSALGMGELDARLHAEPFHAPFRFDADAALQQWAAADLSSRVGGSSRPLLWVRELLASYATGGWYAGLGRMRYASSTLGTLDGLRLEAPLGQGFSVSAFGGLLPNPLSGELSTDAERFGLEAKFNRPDLALRPEAALVVHGSQFGGNLDERRISGMFAIFPGLSRLGGHFEVSNFPANNPWNAGAVELTAAGLDSSVRFGPLEISARGDLLQPERSLWLASFLPETWFCTPVPAAMPSKTLVEPCSTTTDNRILGSIDAGLSLDRFSLVLGGTAMGDLATTPSSEHMIGGFATARVMRLAQVLRIEASANVSTGSYMMMFGGTAGPGFTLLKDTLDVGLYGRLEELQYSATSGFLTQEAGGATVMFFPSSVVMFTLQSEAIAGDDTQAVLVFGSLTWHPRF